jgi:D-proline reductase (dithiol) PrdB
MKDKEEGKSPGPRRVAEDEFLESEESSPSQISAQPLDTLRDGYSWIRALETRYPGWHLHPAEGFPFSLPVKRLSDSRVCLISLAGVYRKGQRPFSTSPGMIPANLRSMRFKDRGDCSFREIPLEAESIELGIAHAHYDHVEADEDINCVFPLMRLLELEVEGFIGECADVHYTMMGYVPEVDRIVATAVNEMIPLLKQRNIDVAVISGGCELSHQSAALIQREVETAGIATVGVTVCPDITEKLNVPRAVALRFPMGSPFGAPLDAPMQLRVLRDALSLIETVKVPGEIAKLPYDWIKL